MIVTKRVITNFRIFVTANIFVHKVRSTITTHRICGVIPTLQRITRGSVGILIVPPLHRSNAYKSLCWVRSNRDRRTVRCRNFPMSWTTWTTFMIFLWTSTSWRFNLIHPTLRTSFYETCEYMENKNPDTHVQNIFIFLYVLKKSIFC